MAARSCTPAACSRFLSWRRTCTSTTASTTRSTKLTFQLGGAYNFGVARLFGQYTHVDDKGNDTKNKLATAGVSVPLGPGTVLAQIARSTAKGPAVDRKHTTTSLGYVYNYEGLADFYVMAMDDRVSNQTRGVSYAAGVRYRFSVP